MEVFVAKRLFHIWKLELWWVAFDDPQFYPKGRKHLKSNWFWRKKKDED
jgi:hypothetical protein